MKEHSMITCYDIAAMLRRITLCDFYKSPKYGINSYNDGFIMNIDRMFARRDLTFKDKHSYKIAVITDNRYMDLMVADQYIVFVCDQFGSQPTLVEIIKTILQRLQIEWVPNYKRFTYQFCGVKRVASQEEICLGRVERLHQIKFNDHKLHLVVKLNYDNPAGVIMQNIFCVVEYDFVKKLFRNQYDCKILQLVVTPGFTYDVDIVKRYVEDVISKNYSQDIQLTFKW